MSHVYFYKATITCVKYLFKNPDLFVDICCTIDGLVSSVLSRCQHWYRDFFCGKISACYVIISIKRRVSRSYQHFTYQHSNFSLTYQLSSYFAGSKNKTDHETIFPFRISCCHVTGYLCAKFIKASGT